MANNYIVDVKNLTKKFDQFEALKGISFQLKKGEIVGFLGPNGAGKTTTIQCLMGITSPTFGSVSLFGLNFKDHREQILQRINFSSAYISLPEKLTVTENLIVFAMLYSVKNAKEKIKGLLELFEIGHLKDKVVVQLSAGQKTRVSFAKALLNDPEILLLDEPMASLDPHAAKIAREFLIKIQKERNLTILYTSHNMNEVEKICDRIIFLNQGKIMVEGTPLQVTRKVLQLGHKEPDLESVFLKLAEDTSEGSLDELV